MLIHGVLSCSPPTSQLFFFSLELHHGDLRQKLLNGWSHVSQSRSFNHLYSGKQGMLFCSYKIWAGQFIFALDLAQGTTSSMGKVIVITRTNINVSNEIIWGTTCNIFPSGHSGQDFQTLHDSPSLQLLCYFPHTFLPNVSTVVCYSNSFLLEGW